jgi:hypothetical protein
LNIAIVRRIIKKKKKEYRRSEWNSINRAKNCKSFWKKFNVLRGKGKDKATVLDKEKWVEYLTGLERIRQNKRNYVEEGSNR